MPGLKGVKWPHIVGSISPSLGSLVLLVVLLSAGGVYHWIAMSVEAAPPGSDGGNWLAFSMELFGDNVKAATAVYPPAFPVVLHVFQIFMSPLLALKVLGLAATVCVAIPVYLLLRTAINPWLSALLASSVVIMDYQNELLAWGGYPQLFGAVFLLLSVYLLLRGLHTGKAWFFVTSALATVLTVAIHTLAAIQLVIALLALVAIYSYEHRRVASPFPRRLIARLLLLWVAITGVLMLAVIPFYVWTVLLLADNPFNPQQFSIVEFFGNFLSWRFEYYMWLIIAVLCGPFSVWAVLKKRHLLLAEAVLAFWVSAVLVFFALYEVRSSHLIQLGLLLSVGVAVVLIKEGAISWMSRFNRQAVWAVTIALFIALLSGIVIPGEQRARQAFEWYRVVDETVLESLDWLRVNGIPGDRVIANETPRGNILGWWVEGYARMPTYFAVDARWLAFREEKSQAEVAHLFLSPESKPVEIRRLTEAHNIKFALLHKETLENPLGNLEEAGFATVFENKAMIILSYESKGPGE